jgi:exo-beta-1,3-glucanase (GH17 family)
MRGRIFRGTAAWDKVARRSPAKEDEPSMRLLSLLAVLVVALLAEGAFWYLPNRPVPLDPPPGGKLRSLSFAPFRDGQSPLVGILPTARQIEEDLKTVAAQTASVRTYTSQEGLQILPELARQHGMTITMGAWLSTLPEKNDAEIASLIDLANRYPDVITRVIVGNEVLLRRDLKVDQLIGYIDRVKAAVKQPVSYADVWEWWLKYPQVADHVDYVTIHLLPYWEDVPTSAVGAMERIDHAYRIIAAKFPGKPILVGETGWPTKGRARGPGVPGVVEMAQFTNNLIRLAEKEGFDYNIIEAFDQGWKQALEGTVGGNWGLYDTQRRAKFDVAGPVVADVDWPWLLGASALLTMFLLALAGGFALPAGSFTLAAALSGVLATGFVLAADRVWSWAYYPADQALGAALLAVQAVLAPAILIAARRALAGPRLAAEPLRGLIQSLGPVPLSRLGGGTALVLTLTGVVWAALVAFDGRYRGFPNPHFLILGLGLPLLGLIRAIRRPAGMPAIAAFAFGHLFRDGAPRQGEGRAWPDAVLGWLLIALAAATVISEGFVPMESIVQGQQPFLVALGEVDWTQPNWMAFGWAGLLVLMALPYLATARLVQRHRQAV